MIDTHCHLTDERLHTQLGDVLVGAARVGVTRVVTIGTDLDDSRRCVELCQNRPNVRCAVGVIPNNIPGTGLPAETLPALRDLQRDPAVVAIGEIGLDYYWSKDPAVHGRQQGVFIEQLQLARECGKPVVIHCREAVADTLAIMKDFPEVRAVFHCFTGTTEEAGSIFDQGYLMGFAGVATFKKNQWLRDIARTAPADRVLVETDAPYMAPEPMRKQKVNEPALVVHTARAIADARGMGYDAFDALVNENASRFFGWR